MIWLVSLERRERHARRRIFPEVWAGRIRRVFLKILPAARPVEPDAEELYLVADAVFVPQTADVLKQRKLVSTRIEELKKVAGWADFTSTPGWDDDFTLNSGGPIDLAWASRDVLLALAGVTEEMVDRFLHVRQGPDGIDGTEDDGEIRSAQEALPIMGLNQEQAKQLLNGGLVTFNDPVYRVVSVGNAGRATRTVQMIFRRVGAMPQLITWKEF